ncbi:MAG: 3-methylcrotonyl-CoA carboxylase, partial [Lysobacter sp.]|nr:3-methylcrotonyl-CoA carboxylase [Lysobacter sp.]
TRLQVEHPVTELVTGQDLVEWQLRVAAGEPLPLAQDAVAQHGHAIEVRLYAEDPEAGFLPGSGTLERLRLPSPSPHVRIDSGVVEGDTVTIFYDPMIAKLIVWDADRAAALARLRDALAQCEVEGPKSNIAFLERLARHPAIVEGTIDTGYLDRHLDEFLPAPHVDTDLLLAAATARLLDQEAEARAAAARSGDPTSPWAIADGWRLGHAGKRELAFLHRGERVDVVAHGSAGDYRIEHAGEAQAIAGARLDGEQLSLRIGERGRRLHVFADARRVLVHDGERRLAVAPIAAYRSEAGAQGAGDDRLKAPMPGRVVLVRAQPGDQVTAGQELLVLEAMKMELALKAPRDGVVAEMRAKAGDFVEAEAVLVVLES